MSEIKRRDRKILKRVRQVVIKWSCTPERWGKCGDPFCTSGREHVQWLRDVFEQVAVNRFSRKCAEQWEDEQATHRQAHRTKEEAK